MSLIKYIEQTLKLVVCKYIICSPQRAFHLSGLHAVCISLAHSIIIFSVRHIFIYSYSRSTEVPGDLLFHHSKFVSVCKLGMTNLWILNIAATSVGSTLVFETTGVRGFAFTPSMIRPD